MDSVQKMLSDACDEMGGECQFRNNYSGRAMYGRKCVGITGSMSDCQRVMAAVAGNMAQELFDAAIDCAEDEETAAYDLNDKVQEALDSLFKFSWDSMGLDVIVYFPGLEPLEEDASLSDEWIDQQSERTLLEWVSENSEYHSGDDDVESLTALRATVRMMRDRMADDHA